jgi:hypothetical protein
MIMRYPLRCAPGLAHSAALRGWPTPLRSGAGCAQRITQSSIVAGESAKENFGKWWLNKSAMNLLHARQQLRAEAAAQAYPLDASARGRRGRAR